MATVGLSVAYAITKDINVLAIAIALGACDILVVLILYKRLCRQLKHLREYNQLPTVLEPTQEALQQAREEHQRSGKPVVPINPPTPPPPRHIMPTAGIIAYL